MPVAQPLLNAAWELRSWLAGGQSDLVLGWRYLGFGLRLPCGL